MRQLFKGLLLVLVLQSTVLAQTGSVSGTVVDSTGVLIEGARVTLCLQQQEQEAWTDAVGAFLFSEVEAGAYLARASMPEVGMDAHPIEVITDEETVVDFILHMGPHGGPHDPNHPHPHPGGHWPHNWEEIELAGMAIVMPAENNPELNHYFLDEDSDGEADYRLGFGPPWYEPESGAERPENGDEIEIVGGLIGTNHGEDLETVIVWDLNGEVWFDPEEYGHHEHYPEIVDVEGWAIVTDIEEPCNQYWLDEDGDGISEFRLLFGPPDYDPGNGATRPAQDDWVEITGGLHAHSPGSPSIVVYEINGLFWSAPGDTTGMTVIYESVTGSEPVTNAGSVDLVKAYPNPFNPVTNVQFSVAQPGPVAVTVYNVLGEQVQTLVDDYLQAGIHTRQLDGGSLPSGLYLVRVQTADRFSITRVLLAK